MRHTQKKRISPPVSISEMGGCDDDDDDGDGDDIVVVVVGGIAGEAREGRSPEENHVSRTSSSCSRRKAAEGYPST